MIELLPARDAEALLDHWLFDDRRTLESIHNHAHGPPPDLDPERRWERLIRRLRRDFASGWLVFHRVRENWANPGARPVEPRPPPKSLPPPPVVRTWVEIALVTSDGRPVPREPVRLTTPAGATVEAALDEDGVLHLDHLESGVCDVTFPRIDGREWGTRGASWPEEELRSPDADRDVVVAPGECLSSLASGAGFRALDTVWKHNANRDLRRERPNPNLLAPGDVLVIPGWRERLASAPTGTRTTFSVLESLTQLRIQFQGRRPQRYRLEVGPRRYTGVVEEGGMIEAEVPATATQGTLVLEAKDHEGTAQRLELMLGWLNPVEQESGERSRLANLAFLAGEADELSLDRARASFAGWAGGAYAAGRLGSSHDGGR